VKLLITGCVGVYQGERCTKGSMGRVNGLEQERRESKKADEVTKNDLGRFYGNISLAERSVT
jgi:hypothetical protein